jgi:hypothetical protein
VCVSLALGAKGELRAPPSVSARGVPGVDGSDIALRAIALEATRAVETFRAGSSLPLVDQVRQRARRKVEDISGVRAIVDVQVLEIG